VVKPDAGRTFAVEPWVVREPSLDIAAMGQTESVFALSNGHIGLRGNLDEGDPHHLPGTYLNSLYEVRPLPYAEGGYGYPESGQTIINVTNGKLIRLLVDDEPFDLRYGKLRRHERVLDLRAGTLHREVEWESPAGRVVRVRSTRLVSLTQRAIAAICYEVEVLDEAALLVVQSELVANEQLPARGADDPRLEAALTNALVSEMFRADEAGATLVHTTRKSGLRVAAAMDHEVHGPEGIKITSDATEDAGSTTIIGRVQPGERLKVVKYLSYGWSSQRSLPAVYDQVRAALAAARYTGWDGLLREQADYLEDFWETADVEIDGDAELQQAVRLATFHVLQAGARAERRCISAKGLTADGYDGHTFWDTETFCLQVLSFLAPDAAADALRWRQSILPQAFERAQQLGLDGAAFPWRTIRGEECSGYWPAGTAAFHINADIADAVRRHVAATGDTNFELEVGLEILVATARLWRSLGHHDSAGEFRIDGVTGPDEYSAIVDNNVYTNLMAAHNLAAAADWSTRHRSEAAGLGVLPEEVDLWRRAAKAISIPFDSRLGVHAQDQDCLTHDVWDFEHTPMDHYPLLLHYPYFELYRKQVVKQADLVLALHLCGEHFTLEQKRAAFDYYETLTVRDSSLSACTQAVVAAEVGHMELAYDYLSEAALMDIHDLNHNTSDGVHIASLGGAVIAIIAGLGGMRELDHKVLFRPRLPEGLDRVAFHTSTRGARLRVEMRDDTASYEVMAGGPVTILHYDHETELAQGDPITLKIPAAPDLPAPTQPPGCEPKVRRMRD